MDEKFNLKALEDYSDDYASKVTASYFLANEKITGPAILKLCEVHQVNLFVVRELLHAWRLEGQKLRSPFFDYSAQAVADALLKFQNTLSNHISISKENFQPLLKKAVSQTLFLILDPYDFYSNTVDSGKGSALKVEDLKNDIKYIKINRVPLERLMNELEEKKLSSLSGNEAFGMLDRILEEVNFTPEDIDPYVALFSKVVPLDISTWYSAKPAVEAAQPVMAEIAKPIAAKKEEPKPEPAKKVAAAQTTLYDQFSKSTGTSLAEDFQKRKKIKDSLTINQKFMFTKILFNGDFELFSAAIERLDELDTMAQANNYINNNYGEWSKDSEEYQEFMEIVERRFA